MIKSWTDEAWADYIYWQEENRKILKHVNALLRDIDRNGNEGTGKPEPLKDNFQGYWSRRINSEHRLIYSVDGKGIVILSCRYHYGEK